MKITGKDKMTPSSSTPKEIAESNKMKRISTNIQARNGDILHTGDIIQTVQDTIFVVVARGDTFYLSRPEGLYNLKEYMSPNIWIIGTIVENPELAPWI